MSSEELSWAGLTLTLTWKVSSCSRGLCFPGWALQPPAALVLDAPSTPSVGPLVPAPSGGPCLASAHCWVLPPAGLISRLPSSSSSRGGLPQSPRSAPQDSGPPRLSRCCPGLPIQPPLTKSSRLLINIFGVPPCHLRPDLPKTRLSNMPAPGYPFPSVVGAWGQPVPPLGTQQ